MDAPRPLTWSLLLVLLCSVLIVTALTYAGRRDRELQAQALAEAKEAKFADATSLQVWAAGFRNADGQFCSPCSPNPTVLYETSNSAEVRIVLSKFHYRRRPSEGPEVAHCGPITFCFLRDGRVLHSCNLKPERLEDDSWVFVDSWLTRHDLWNKAQAILSGPRKIR